ncbi:hypothetical protein KKF59_04770 [Patescibacteria group bacterium]|nr:hypothetical protein [Patescibacteria group bacterium]
MRHTYIYIIGLVALIVGCSESPLEKLGNGGGGATATGGGGSGGGPSCVEGDECPTKGATCEDACERELFCSAESKWSAGSDAEACITCEAGAKCETPGDTCEDACDRELFCSADSKWTAPADAPSCFICEEGKECETPGESCWEKACSRDLFCSPDKKWTAPKGSECQSAGGGGAGGEGGNAGGAGGCAGGAGGEGGSGGATLDCSDVTSGHFVVKVQKDYVASGDYLAADGFKDYPANSGLTDLPWGNLFIGTKGATTAVWDDGAVPVNSSYELNFGASHDGATQPLDPNNPNGLKIAVDDGTWFCYASGCPAIILICYGSEELGRINDGTVTGGVKPSQSGANWLVKTQ